MYNLTTLLDTYEFGHSAQVVHIVNIAVHCRLQIRCYRPFIDSRNALSIEKENKFIIR